VLGVRGGWSTARLVAPGIAMCAMSIVIRARVSNPESGKLIHAVFGTDTRMDALFAGCLLAFVVSRVEGPRAFRHAGLACFRRTRVRGSLWRRDGALDGQPGRVFSP